LFGGGIPIFSKTNFPLKRICETFAEKPLCHLPLMSKSFQKMSVLPRHVVVNNPQGQPVFVQISMEEWAKFVADFQRMQSLLIFKRRFQRAFREVRDIQSGKKKAVTLSEFLHEL